MFMVIFDNLRLDFIVLRFETLTGRVTAILSGTYKYRIQLMLLKGS